MPPPSSTSHSPSGAPPIIPPNQVNTEAARGFLSGALRFTSISIIAHILLQRVHPIYRGLTLQFKIFVQLSAATLGGCIFAEKRVSEYNNMVRRQQRALERSNRAWSEELELRAAMERREMERGSGNHAEAEEG
jgi:hypothetical protein